MNNGWRVVIVGLVAAVLLTVFALVARQRYRIGWVAVVSWYAMIVIACTTVGVLTYRIDRSARPTPTTTTP